MQPVAQLAVFQFIQGANQLGGFPVGRQPFAKQNLELPDRHRICSTSASGIAMLLSVSANYSRHCMNVDKEPPASTPSLYLLATEIRKGDPACGKVEALHLVQGDSSQSKHVRALSYLRKRKSRKFFRQK